MTPARLRVHKACRSEQSLQIFFDEVSRSDRCLRIFLSLVLRPISRCSKGEPASLVKPIAILGQLGEAQSHPSVTLWGAQA
jgi:hypothetical protein